MKQNKTLLFTLFFMLSCGGGGGGGSAPAPVISQTPTPPVAPPTLSYDELKAQYEGYYEYQGQWGLDVVNASAAYARGATGLGITIGITDSGLDNTHTEISAGRLSGDSDLSYSNYTPNTRQQRHGTMVASVAAGKQEKTDTSPMHGVAFEANVLFIAIQLAEPDPDYDPVDIGTDDGSGTVTDAPDFTGIDNFFSSLFEIYNQYDVDIVNNSYGYSGNIIDYTEAQVRYAFPKTIAEMSQIGTPDSQKTIYVWAAGNAGGYADQGVDFSSPELLPGMAHYIPEIQGHSIAVASVDENGSISSFSSRCGVAQDYCISAPGGRITAAYPTSTSDTGIYIGNTNDDNYNSCIQDNSCFAVTSGTSFAAPFVSGGLAVIADYFEGQLGSKEIVDRLFSTANKEGVYSDKAIYGQGLMDLGAATAPVGQVSAMLTGTLSGAMVPALFTGIQLTSPSFGDAVSNGVANQTIIFFDELDAPFRGAVDNLTTDYRNQIVNLDRYDHMYQSTPQIIDSQDNVLEVSNYKNQNLSYGLINSMYLLEAQQDSNQFFTYFNKGNNSFVSHGINGSWALGIFQDKDLRYKSQLRSQFSNPWLNFSAGGTSFGSVYKFQHKLDVAFLISSGRNRFQANEVFGESNSSTVAMIELQPKNYMPSIQFGILKENDANLGLSGSGAFNGNSGQMTSFVGISDSINLFGGKFFSSLYIGNSPGTSNNEGMINSITDIQSSAYGMGFLKQSIFNSGDELLLSIDQPMRTESGEMNLRVPVYRTTERNVLFNSFGFTLRPSGREVHSKARYMSSYKNIGLSLTLGYKSDPYHIKSLEDYWYTALGFSIKI
ncbi:S8 family serine peptidase [Gammaproteobacteria bacterium]|nr:S8 family serine peptidase [Gammaproteobacteria bacterium]MDB2665857.1 S8 family serine peptidase [Gammaproteobacteria bacterium]MDB9841262.1 S8 family serine peptidase [Gammaproteobacteria bacterium]